MLLKIKTSITTNGGTTACRIISSHLKFPAPGSFSIRPTGIKIHMKIKHVIETKIATVNRAFSNAGVNFFTLLVPSLTTKNKEIIVTIRARKLDCSVKNINW
ncbi:hypothetical protein IJQ19_02465 [bacterium]|nr:hypothetical protein [bacterium]